MLCNLVQGCKMSVVSVTTTRSQIKTVQYTDGLIEIAIKNGKIIKINSDNFPKINMRGLASYVKSVMSDKGEIKNEFFEHEDSGFNISRKIVMEKRNEWSRVLFIFFVFFVITMIIYWLFNLVFT